MSFLFCIWIHYTPKPINSQQIIPAVTNFLKNFHNLHNSGFLFLPGLSERHKTEAAALVFSAPESALCFEESHEEIDMDPMKRQETLELVKAYYRIPNRKAAKYLFDLIVTMSKTTSDRGQDSDEE